MIDNPFIRLAYRVLGERNDPGDASWRVEKIPLLPGIVFTTYGTTIGIKNNVQRDEISTGEIHHCLVHAWLDKSRGVQEIISRKVPPGLV